MLFIWAAPLATSTSNSVGFMAEFPVGLENYYFPLLSWDNLSFSLDTLFLRIRSHSSCMYLMALWPLLGQWDPWDVPCRISGRFCSMWEHASLPQLCELHTQLNTRSHPEPEVILGMRVKHRIQTASKKLLQKMNLQNPPGWIFMSFMDLREK